VTRVSFSWGCRIPTRSGGVRSLSVVKRRCRPDGPSRWLATSGKTTIRTARRDSRRAAGRGYSPTAIEPTKGRGLRPGGHGQQYQPATVTHANQPCRRLIRAPTALLHYLRQPCSVLRAIQLDPLDLLRIVNTPKVHLHHHRRVAHIAPPYSAPKNPLVASTPASVYSPGHPTSQIHPPAASTPLPVAAPTPPSNAPPIAAITRPGICPETASVLRISDRRGNRVSRPY
jgi:hypothetical protein